MVSTKRARQTNFGYMRPIALALSRPSLAAHALLVVIEAFRSFFLPQFENALLRRRPVVNVDHPLDESIAFDPGYMKKYMEFIRLWMGSFYRLGSVYGYRIVPELLDYVDSIRSLYAEAGSVYKTVHTTTTRPSKNINLRFALIHALDPHLDCVPSLHVILVLANWLMSSEITARLGAEGAKGFDQARLELWAESLYAEALAITESVLFVKQHSVNCVGASLYYLKLRFPAFGDAQARAFVDSLFASHNGSLPTAQKLRDVILEVCDKMEKSHRQRPELGWRAPILEFIDSFAL